LPISAVVNPPTARSVRASWEGSDREGWQQRKRSVSVSSWSGGSARPGALAPPLVDQSTSGDRHEPGSRVVRHARLGPLLCRGQQRFLHGVFAGVELAVSPDERAEDLRRELAQQVLDAHLDRRHGDGR
jgi:hypothetical protein